MQLRTQIRLRARSTRTHARSCMQSLQEAHASQFLRRHHHHQQLEEFQQLEDGIAIRMSEQQPAAAAALCRHQQLCHAK